MIKALKYAASSLLVLVLSACGGEPASPVTKKLETLKSDEGQHLLLREVASLNEWVLRQQKKYDSTDSYVFQNILVKDLYQNPYKHFRFTTSILKDNSIDVELKKQLVRLSQCLKLKDYLSLGIIVSDIGDVELMTVFISPGPEYGTILDDNYLNPLVVMFLDDLAVRYPSLEKTIDLIRNGINSRRINAYRKTGESYPILNCSVKK